MLLGVEKIPCAVRSFVYIPLNRGFVAKVDPQDYVAVCCRVWTISTLGGDYQYAQTTHIDKAGRKSNILMHVLLMTPPPGMVVDHRDNDGLNNIRSNLRVCTRKQNNLNRGSTRTSTSRYKGVSWDNATGKWLAQIGINGKRTYLGVFADEEEAARVYDSVARKVFGDFAWVNFSPKQSQTHRAKSSRSEL